MNPWLQRGLGLGLGLGVLLLTSTKAFATPIKGKRRRYGGGEAFEAKVYTPGSSKQIHLFEQAADIAGVPRQWAASDALANLLKRESGGKVGIPNYTYGDRSKDESRWPEVWEELKRGEVSTKSTATGLGQLTLSNVKSCYPSGVAGIGDALEEAAGMLCYIKKRYGSPEAAWEFWQQNHWY